MSEFLHGVEVIELGGGPQPIKGVSSSIIGLVGTAHTQQQKMDSGLPPPVLIAGSQKQATEYFGEPDGVSTLPDALKGIFDQTAALVVCVNVGSNISIKSEDVTLVKGKGILKEKTNKVLYIDKISIKQATESQPLAEGIKDSTIVLKLNENVEYNKNTQEITLIDEASKKLYSNATLSVSYAYEDQSKIKENDIINGIEALRSAESVVHVSPRILAAPGFSHLKPIAEKLAKTAESLRAVAIADCPQGKAKDDKDVAQEYATGMGAGESDAITYRNNFTSSRLLLIDPAVKLQGTSGNEYIMPASARVAGVIAKSDTERGFWYSPSNRPILGINGTSRPISFALGDKLSEANMLNENDVATIVRQDGYRLWGNHTCSTDQKWKFISVRRTADLINDSLQRAHLWAVDRNINKTYIDEVSEAVNDYLRHLKSIGAIIDGKCWADKDINTKDQIIQGIVTFSFDFVPPYPAEHIKFQSILNNKYLEEIFA